jgi:uncharacterized protein (TIGR01777 family)
MNILISGGSGFIGRQLISRLILQGHKVTIVSRQSQNKVRKWLVANPDITWLQWGIDRPLHVNEIGLHEVVINLAGEGVADRRWSASRKQQLRDSRIRFTNSLIRWIEEQEWRPSTWLNASAIGYYGISDQPSDESFASGDDFASVLCRDWESAAAQCSRWDCRYVCMRFGVVLGHGGMLKKLKPSFYMGLGAQLGHGRQGLSWIHMEDLLNACLFLLSNERLSGNFNLTSPHPVSNCEFTRALATSLNRQSWLIMPAWFMKLVLGEMAETLLLSGQWVYPQRLQDEGFEFNFPEINTALEDIFR